MPVQAYEALKPVLAPFKPAPSVPMTPAQSDWLDLADKYDHQKRLCEGLLKFQQATEELQAVQVWSGQPDGPNIVADLTSSLALIETDQNEFVAGLGAIAPLPSPPGD